MSSQRCLKIVSRFGNRRALQESVFGCSPGNDIETYVKVGEVSCPDVTNVVFVDKKVQVAENKDQNPTETIIFGVITASGERTLNRVIFMVRRDFSVQGWAHEELAKSNEFQDGFTLHQVIGTSEGFTLQKDGQSVTYMLCLIQKANQQLTIGRAPLKKPHASLQLVAFSTEKCSDIFTAPGTAEELLERPVQCKFSDQRLGILINQGNYHTESQYLYLYDLESHSYSGFINMNKILGVDTKKSPTDFVFIDDNAQGALAVMNRDVVYLLGQKQDDWQLFHKQDGITDLNQSIINSLQLHQIQSSQNTEEILFVALVNRTCLLAVPESGLNLKLDSQGDPKTSIQKLFALKQRSQSLYHPKLLTELFNKGYTLLVVKILVKLMEMLKAEQDKICDYLDMDLSSLLIELKSQSEAFAIGQGGQAPVPAGKGAAKKQTAYSVFDDLEASSSEEEKKEEEKNDDTVDIKQQFREGADELIKNLQNKQSLDILGLDPIQIFNLISFILKFKNIFEIDFQTDTLASMLLRKVFCETEKIDEEQLQKAQEQLKKQEKEINSENQLDIMNYQVQEVKPFSMEDFMAQHVANKQQVKSYGDLHLVKEWNSAMVCQAMHSVDQDEILKRLSERFDFEKNLNWETMRKLSIPVWINRLNSEKLKQLTLYIAQNEYNQARADDQKKNPKAEYAALWYILLKKLAVLQKLYSVEPGQEKFAAFFSKDFTDKKTQTVAGKNAAALVPKQKYHLSCGFFILGQNLRDACSIAIDRCQDPVLVILMCRIFDPENKTGEIDKVAQKWFIERGEKFNDPYLISMGYWLKKEFVKAVNQLSPTLQDSCLNYIYANEVTEFDLVKPSGAEEQKIEQQKSSTVYPTVSKRSYLILDLVKKLEKAPDVKKALNKNWTLAIDRKPGKGAAPSIFDDLMGGGSDSSSEEEKVEEKKEAIEVDEAAVLTNAVQQTIAQRQTVIGLLLMEENKALATKVDQAMSKRLLQTVMMDQIVNIFNQNQEDFNDVVLQIRKSKKLLSELLCLESHQNRAYLHKQLRKLGLFKILINYLIEQKVSPSSNLEQLRFIELESKKLWRLMQANFLCGGFSMNAWDYDPDGNRDILPIIDCLQDILDCLLLQGNQDGIGRVETPDLIKTSSLALQKKKTQAVGDDGEIDDIGASSDEGEAVREIKSLISTASKPVQPSKMTKQVSLDTRRGTKDAVADESTSQRTSLKDMAIEGVCIKFRAVTTLMACLCSLATTTAKYNQFRGFIQELQKFMGVSAYGSQLDNKQITEEMLTQLTQSFQLQHVKIMVKKLRLTVQQNIEHYEQPLQYEDSIRVRRKPARIIDQKQDHYDFLDVYFRSLMAKEMASVFETRQLQNCKMLNNAAVSSEDSQNMESLLQLHVQQQESLGVQRLKDMYSNLAESLEDVASYTLKNFIDQKAQKDIVGALEKIIESRFTTNKVKGYNLEFFVGNPAKLKQLAISLDLQEKFTYLKDYQMGIVDNCSDAEGIAQSEQLLSSGIELFKQRQEQVVDLCFDHAKNDMVAFAIQAKGMREISVVDTLVYRNRVAGGLEVVDEDQMSWNECLHRYEPIQAVHQNLRPKAESIRATIASMYSISKTSSAHKRSSLVNTTMTDHEPSPPKFWDDSPASLYTKNYSQHLITHDDYTNAIESHPYLPLYISGNAKGLVCLWNFNQMADKSLNQWILDKDTPPAQANPKKSTLKKLAFTSYGNKFMALNTGGHLFMMNFDLHESSKYDPLFSTLTHVPRGSTTDSRLSDAQLMDEDSIIAGVSVKDKVLNLYDTLLPPRCSVVQTYKQPGAGNILQVCSNAQKILCFNSKPGFVSEYDIRMQNQTVNQKQLIKEEITSCTLNTVQDSLILGTASGVVKIFDLKNGNYDEKASINAFTNVMGQRGAVSKLKIHPYNKGLFAASNVGCMKLLRFNV